jgi:hypothetical protein
MRATCCAVNQFCQSPTSPEREKIMNSNIELRRYEECLNYLPLPFVTVEHLQIKLLKKKKKIIGTLCPAGSAFIQPSCFWPWCAQTWAFIESPVDSDNCQGFNFTFALYRFVRKMLRLGSVFQLCHTTELHVQHTKPLQSRLFLLCVYVQFQHSSLNCGFGSSVDLQILVKNRGCCLTFFVFE